jgi:hypothetical protein
MFMKKVVLISRMMGELVYGKKTRTIGNHSEL